LAVPPRAVPWRSAGGQRGGIGVPVAVEIAAGDMSAYGHRSAVLVAALDLFLLRLAEIFEEGQNWSRLMSCWRKKITP